MNKEEKIQELAYKIAELLKKHECHHDVAIYFSEKRLCTFNDEYEWELQEGYVGTDFSEYANNDTITMTFEGYFYELINYMWDGKVVSEFRKLIQEYGYNYELGNAWNLTLWED